MKHKGRANLYKNTKNEMKVYPHILLKKGDIIRIPGGVADHIVSVVGLIDGRLLVEFYNNRFAVPWGFYLKKENYFVPLL